MITLCSGHFLNKLTRNWVVKTDSIVVQIELGTVLKQLFIFVLSCHYTRLVEGISLFPSVRFSQLHWTLSEVFCSISGHFSSFLVPLNLSVQFLKIRVTGVDTLHLRVYVLYGLSAWWHRNSYFYGLVHWKLTQCSDLSFRMYIGSGLNTERAKAVSFKQKCHWSKVRVP